MENQLGTYNEQFEELLKELPEDLRESAREFEAFTRGRKISTPEELLHLVFLYCGVDKSLREVAGIVTLLGGETLSDTAIHKRLKACGPWIKVMLSKMLPSLELEELPDGIRLLVVDATTVQAPGANGTDYRLHFCIDLLTLEIVQIQVTDVHVGESLQNFEVQPGDVFIGDKGYSHATGIKEVEEKGGYTIIRLNQATMPLYKENGEELDLKQFVEKVKEIESIRVSAGVQEEEKRVHGRLHVVRLPKKKAARARKRYRAQALKHGRKVSKEGKFLAGYIIVFTTLENLMIETILKLYPLRWQVELVIKRLKSILNIDKLRAKRGGELADVWIHGKLLYALLIEKRMKKRVNKDWNYLEQERKGTVWRVLKLVKNEVDQIIVGTRFWLKDRWEACLKVMAERRRKRKLDKLPENIKYLLMERPDLSVQETCST